MENTDNTRYYNFEWYDNRDAKGGNPIIRHTNVTLQRFTRDTGIDTKMALQLFMAANGNLKKNTIVRIKEFNEHGQIGEDITPSNEENSIVPIGK